MKNAQIIDVLNIALLKIEPQIVFLCEEMEAWASVISGTEVDRGRPRKPVKLLRAY